MGQQQLRWQGSVYWGIDWGTSKGTRMRYKCRGSFGFKTDKHAHISTGRWSQFMVSIIRYSILNPSIDLLQHAHCLIDHHFNIGYHTHPACAHTQSTVPSWHFQFLAQSNSILMVHSTTNNRKASVQGIPTGQSCGACTHSIGECLYHSFCYTDRHRVWGHGVQLDAIAFIYVMHLAHPEFAHIVRHVSRILSPDLLSATTLNASNT